MLHMSIYTSKFESERLRAEVGSRERSRFLRCHELSRFSELVQIAGDLDAD